MESNESLRVLSAGAVKTGVARIAQEFERTTGTRVSVEFSTAPELRKRVAGGEQADVIVAPPNAMEEFHKLGKILADSRAFVGRSRMGVIVHAEAPAPDVSDTAAFAKALRAASAVVYNKASSGIYSAKLMEKLGLDRELAGRFIVVDTGSAIMRKVAELPPGAAGLAQISEIMVMIEKGCRVKLVAPLPDEIQNVTSYDAAAAASSAMPEAARRLAAALTSDAAKKIFAATGIS